MFQVSVLGFDIHVSFQSLMGTSLQVCRSVSVASYPIVCSVSVSALDDPYLSCCDLSTVTYEYTYIHTYAYTGTILFASQLHKSQLMQMSNVFVFASILSHLLPAMLTVITLSRFKNNENAFKLCHRPMIHELN